MSIAEGLSGIFEDPSLLNRANTWSQTQTQGSHFYNYSNLANYEDLPSGGFVTWEFGRIGQFVVSGTGSSARVQVLNYNGSKNNSISLGIVPTASNPTFASGTIYQNTTDSYQRLIVPVYASTAGTAGTAAVALGTSSTPSTIATEYISGSTSSTSQKVLESCATIPPGWYYSVTLTGASFGTITQIQM